MSSLSSQLRSVGVCQSSTCSGTSWSSSTDFCRLLPASLLSHGIRATLKGLCASKFSDLSWDPPTWALFLYMLSTAMSGNQTHWKMMQVGHPKSGVPLEKLGHRKIFPLKCLCLSLGIRHLTLELLYEPTVQSVRTLPLFILSYTKIQAPAIYCSLLKQYQQTWNICRQELPAPLLPSCFSWGEWKKISFQDTL